jgi:hypothetical protein
MIAADFRFGTVLGYDLAVFVSHLLSDRVARDCLGEDGVAALLKGSEVVFESSWRVAGFDGDWSSVAVGGGGGCAVASKAVFDLQ